MFSERVQFLLGMIGQVEASNYEEKLGLLRLEQDVLRAEEEPEPKGRWYGPKTCLCPKARCGCRYYVAFGTGKPKNTKTWKDKRIVRGDGYTCPGCGACYKFYLDKATCARSHERV